MIQACTTTYVALGWIEEEQDENRLDDRGDHLTNDNTGRRCKTGDWRRAGKDEEHCDQIK
jgi:hypothetical protein